MAVGSSNVLGVAPEARMFLQRCGVVCLVSVFVLLLTAATSRAAVTSREKPLAEPRDDKGLIYFIRPFKFKSYKRTMFVGVWTAPKNRKPTWCLPPLA